MTKEQAIREALRMALDALKYPLNQSHENFNVDMAELLAHRAITAIKEALAQPEQEPVAWRAPNWGHGDDEWVYRDFDDPVLIAHGRPSPNNEPLYTTPPQRTEKEQQIETLKRCLFQMQEAAKNLVEQAKSLNPPQRTWVGLTEDERAAIRESVSVYHDITGWSYAKAVQQATELKLEEKNTMT